MYSKWSDSWWFRKFWNFTENFYLFPAVPQRSLPPLFQIPVCKKEDYMIRGQHLHDLDIDRIPDRDWYTKETNFVLRDSMRQSNWRPYRNKPSGLLRYVTLWLCKRDEFCPLLRLFSITILTGKEGLTSNYNFRPKLILTEVCLYHKLKPFQQPKNVQFMGNKTSAAVSNTPWCTTYRLTNQTRYWCSTAMIESVLVRLSTPWNIQSSLRSVHYAIAMQEVCII